MNKVSVGTHLMLKYSYKRKNLTYFEVFVCVLEV